MDRFNETRAMMPGQPKQSDIFRVIASRWAKMTPEEKQPFVEEADEDKKRHRDEEIHYNSLRKSIEKSFEVGSNSILRIIPSQNCSQTLRKLFKDRDSVQMVLMLLSLNRYDLKSTIEIVQDCIRLISEQYSVCE